MQLSVFYFIYFSVSVDPWYQVRTPLEMKAVDDNPFDSTVRFSNNESLCKQKTYTKPYVALQPLVLDTNCSI